MTKEKRNLRQAAGMTLFVIGTAGMFTGMHYLWGVLGVIIELGCTFGGYYLLISNRPE